MRRRASVQNWISRRWDWAKVVAQEATTPATTRVKAMSRMTATRGEIPFRAVPEGIRIISLGWLIYALGRLRGRSFGTAFLHGRGLRKGVVGLLVRLFCTGGG